MIVSRKNSIPILLITGFLGSGKTTLLNHLLSNTSGMKIGVIVNDFGDINIDSLLVASQTDTQLELSNGCICCSIADSDLDDAISQLAHKGSLLDYIIIEASGLAEPRELATMLSLMRNEYAHFDSLTTLVDAANFKQNNLNHPSAIDNLAIADIVAINKVDLVGVETLEDIRKGIRLVAPGARIISCSHGRVDPELLLENSAREKHQVQLSIGAEVDPDDLPHEHVHSSYDNLSFETEKPLDPKKFEEWRTNLPESVFRAKGICYFSLKGVEQKYIFQGVGRRTELKLDEWSSGETPTTKLVVIGMGMDKGAIAKSLDNLVDDNPGLVTQETLMDIFKYR